MRIQRRLRLVPTQVGPGRGTLNGRSVPAPQLVTDKRQRSVSTVAATASEFGQLPGPLARAPAPATRQRGLSSTSTGRDPKNSERTSSPKVGSSRSGSDFGPVER